MDNTNITELCNLLDTLPNPVTLNALAYNEKGEACDKIVFVNKSFLKSIGYTKEDIPDERSWFLKAYRDRIYRDYISSQWFKRIGKSKKEKSDIADFPVRINCKDGKERWFNITTQTEYTIRGKYRTVAFIQTESPGEVKQKLDTKSLELIYEKHLLKTIIDSVPVRIFWKNLEGTYLGCNQSFLDDAGLKDVSEIIGKTDYEMVWKEEARLYREDDAKVQDSGVEKLSYIEKQTQKDGKVVTVSTSKVPLKNSGGEIIGVLGLYQDITEEFEAKKALREQEKMMAVQSRQAAMGEVISMIAHQWRQPLSNISAIVNNIQLKQLLGESIEDDMMVKSEKILDQVEYLSRTISGFRDFYRPNNIQEKIQAHDTIEYAVAIVDKRLEDYGIELRSSYQAKTAFYTYANELQQACLNLIKNSADALIEVKKEERWITVSTEENEKHTILTIGDNAGGIDSDILDKVFEPYFSTKREKNGTGLGLYMSKTIIEKQLKGTLQYESSPDGALFKIKLPRITELGFEEKMQERGYS